MQVAHQHDGIVINRTLIEGRYGTVNGFMYRLFAAVEGNLSSRELLERIAQFSYSMFSESIIIHHVEVFVCHVGCLGPVGLDIDVGDTVGHVEVGTLREDAAAAACSSDIFIGTLAVCKVIAIPFVASLVGTCRTASHAGNLPTRHDLVVLIILCTVIVVIGQLDLIVVEVVAVEVLVGTFYFKRLRRNTFATNVDIQRLPQLTAVVATHRDAVRCVFHIIVDDGGIVVLFLQHGIGLGGVVAAVGRLEHPLGHDVGICGTACNIVGCQAPVSVEQQAVELEAFEVLVGNGQGSVVLVVCNMVCRQLRVGIIVIVVQASMHIVDVVSAIDGRLFAATSDVAVERAVHHHRTQVGCGGEIVVVTHDTAHIRTACNLGIAVAVDDTRIVVQQAHDATGIIGAADFSAIHTAVVDVGIARSRGYDGTGMAILVAATEAGTLDDHVLDGSITIGVGDEGCRHAEAMVNLAFDSTLEGCRLGTDGAG